MSTARTFTTTFSVPQILVPAQTGLVSPPLSEGAAAGNNPLSVPQRAIVIGEPIPIVFGRRVGDIGGIFISPGATEGRYINNTTTNDLTINLELVLSDGELPGLLERDLYQRNCRVGTWGQAYNQRAGTWTPGNFIVEIAGKKVWNCPLYCGTGGSYAGMSTLTFTKVYTELDDSWDKQIHAFVREGILVPRIIQNDVTSSNNVVDLAIYLIKKTSRFPDALIDTTAMLLAANFTNTNGFFYNGEYKKSGNLEDWLQDISTPFLLRLSDSNGKKGFIPRLPINNDYSIKTDAVTWEFTFTEEHIQPNGFQIQYVSLADRKPICAVVLWRQQPDDDVGLIRTSEVRMQGEATDGPFEQYDLSEFCTSELHAVKVGAYYVARRKYITHTLRLTVKPDAFNSTLGTGDLVRVTLRRETNVDDVSLHDYLYEVERISKDITGSIVLDLTHFPVNAAGAGLVNLAVANMQPNGIILPSGRNDFSCNVNNDNTAIPNSPGGTGGPGSGGGGDSNVPPEGETPPGPGVPNPGDPVGQPPAPTICGATGSDSIPVPGDELEVCDEVCEGQYNEWYVCDESPTVGATTVIHPSCVKISEGEGAKLIVSPEDSGKRVLVVGRCPDPASPDGYGEPQLAAEATPPIDFPWRQYTHARWNGTIRYFGKLEFGTEDYDETVSYTTPWTTIPAQGLTLSGVWGCFSGSTPLEGPDFSVWQIPAANSTWRSGMTIKQTFPCEGGSLSAARLGPAPNPNACSSGALTVLRFGCVVRSFDFTYAIRGSFEFSNNASTVEATWEGRDPS